MNKHIFWGAVVVLAIVGMIGYYEIHLWSECMSDYGFFYCMRALGR